MKVQDVISPIPVDDGKDNYVVVLNLTSTNDAIKKILYPKQVGVGQPLRPDHDLTFCQNRVTRLNLFIERVSSVAVDTFGVVWTIF